MFFIFCLLVNIDGVLISQVKSDWKEKQRGVKQKVEGELKMGICLLLFIVSVIGRYIQTNKWDHNIQKYRESQTKTKQ